MDLEQVGRAWSRQLASLTPKAIEWAMEHLPSQPLNALEFRALALQRPSPKPIEEVQVPADPRRVARLLEPLRTQPVRGTRQWAIDLQGRELQGEKLSHAQRNMWRAVLGS
jgi:hypothetical protein